MTALARDGHRIYDMQTRKTIGEMPPEEKRQYSHRAAAARALLESGALRQIGQ